MDRTNIEWTDATWNPLRGCSRVSEGCRNCYAERVAARFSGKGMPYEGLAHFVRGVPVDKLEMHDNIRFESEARWTGKVRLVEDVLDKPLRWKRPRRIFVNSMSDLFHESVPDEWITRIFAVMALSPQHTFQVLTKRADRMRTFLTAYGIGDRILEAADRYFEDDETAVFDRLCDGVGDRVRLRWPLPNVWLGVSVENQEAFQKRVGPLLATPAAVRWISAEPLLDGIDLHDGFWKTTRDHTGEYESDPLVKRLDWVVIGGESGPGARPFNIDAAFEMVGECEEAGVPVFVKQFGALPVTWNANRFNWPADPIFVAEARLEGAASARVVLRDRKGGDMEEWPKEFRVRQFPRQAVPA